MVPVLVQIFANVLQDGVATIARYPCVHKNANITVIVLCLIYVPVKGVGQATIVQYRFVHRTVTMVGNALHQILANAYNGKTIGEMVDFMVGFRYIKHQMEILKCLVGRKLLIVLRHIFNPIKT